LADIETSRAIAVERVESSPQLHYPLQLPVSERRDEVLEVVSRHQVTVLCGETGSGKSTQLPKICLELGRGVFGRIGHTQPRRIAARALATRISEELGRELGSTVGYKVRFHDRVSPATRIKLMTDGMLLAEIQHDPLLQEYDTLIIDEAHERSLNIDFLLGYLRRLLPRRPDLKVIVTSATIDPESLAQHFGGAPILEISGRTYPVELRYRPPEEDVAGERDDAMQRAIVGAVDELSGTDRGDILIFLSGEREIRETTETLRKHKLQLTEILPLYARQGSAEQARVFHPAGKRRIVLATNVAETSLTVPGIRYVIDAGFARISRYSARSKVQRLPVEPISQASAKQRAGRCGRVAPGICIRLYDEEDLFGRREFTEPEILRTNLAAVILQMKVAGLGEIESFPFIDRPDQRLVNDGIRLLEELGALGADGRVTRVGRELARLPVDPRIGRMLWAAAHTHCLSELLVIAAALSVQDPRERPLERQQEADEAHELFADEGSDFSSYLGLWVFLEERRRHLSRAKFRKLCQERYLSWSRVTEWHDIHRQLRLQLHELGFRENEADASYEEIHRAILSGLLSHIGFRESEKGYLAGRGAHFSIFPGSSLYRRPPKWVMAAELVETARLYARTVARIEPAWIEAAAGHLVQRSYSEPHWEAGRGQVAAYEKVTLYGLTLVARRKINYGPLNPAEAREIFIRFALVEGDFRTRAPFFRHNAELIDYVRYLEQKLRREDFLADEEARYAFYAARIPEGVYSAPLFEKWLRKASRGDPKLLHMRIGDVLRRPTPEDVGSQFPETWDLNGVELPLEYRLEPGDEADGVTLVVPLELVNQIPEGRCEWLVPGWLEDKAVALLRSLPKQLRKALMPIPETAKRCLTRLQPCDQPLTRALATAIKELTTLHVGEDQWRSDELPDYLKMRFRLIDEHGRTVGKGRDLHQLRTAHGSTASERFTHISADHIERQGMHDWELGELPETVELSRGGVPLRGFPALVDCGEAVDVRVLDSASAAERATRAGVRRLLAFRLGAEMRHLRKHLPGIAEMRLKYAMVPVPEIGLSAPPEEAPTLEAELVGLILDRTFIEGRPPIRDRDSFQARIESEKARLTDVATETCRTVAAILDFYQGVRRDLAHTGQANWRPLVEDIRRQLDLLVYRGFLQEEPGSALVHYPRYLKAIDLRLGKLAHGAGRDFRRLDELKIVYEPWLERYRALRERGQKDTRLEEIRWMLEELRVSLFAQELRTAYPVSLKRIERRWRELGL